MPEPERFCYLVPAPEAAAYLGVPFDIIGYLRRQGLLDFAPPGEVPSKLGYCYFAKDLDAVKTRTDFDDLVKGALRPPPRAKTRRLTRQEQGLCTS